MYIWICKKCGKELNSNELYESTNTVHFHCDICNESYDICGEIFEFKFKNKHGKILKS